MSFPKSTCLVLLSVLLLGLATSSEEDIKISESKRVESLEDTIRRSVNMTYANYKYYPFAIAQKHEFIVEQDDQGQIKGEVHVKWIQGEKNQLKYPTFDKEEYIKLTIIDQYTKSSVQERIFHFQTGFKFTAESSRKYRLIFKNFGSKNKLIEMSISYVEPTSHKLDNHQNATSIFTQSTQKMKQLLTGFEVMTRINEEQMVIDENIHEEVQKNMSSYFTWTVWEILLFGILVFAQIWMIGKEINNSFSSIV